MNATGSMSGPSLRSRGVDIVVSERFVPFENLIGRAQLNRPRRGSPGGVELAVSVRWDRLFTLVQ